MRKSTTAPVVTGKEPTSTGRRDDAPVELVCLALALAVFVLAFRIASIW
jgi:hypothetical protein